MRRGGRLAPVHHFPYADLAVPRLAPLKVNSVERRTSMRTKTLLAL